MLGVSSVPSVSAQSVGSADISALLARIRSLMEQIEALQPPVMQDKERYAVELQKYRSKLALLYAGLRVAKSELTRAQSDAQAKAQAAAITAEAQAQRAAARLQERRLSNELRRVNRTLAQTEKKVPFANLVGPVQTANGSATAAVALSHGGEHGSDTYFKLDWVDPQTVAAHAPIVAGGGLPVTDEPTLPVPTVDGPPVVGNPPPVHASALNHNTDFLTMTGPSGETLYTHMYPARSPEGRKVIRDALKQRGYSHMYMYAVNEVDYGGPAFNLYEDPAGFKQCLSELNADGIDPVVWLAPDDASKFHGSYPPSKLKEVWAEIIPQIDDQVSSYVLGLEMDEYWSPAQQEELGQYLNTLTDKPIFVHYTPGKWEGARAGWADGLIYQYGFGKSPQEIESITRNIVSHLGGKTFIAGEYAHRIPEEEARELGAAALRGGADGFGNGASI